MCRENPRQVNLPRQTFTLEKWPYPYPWGHIYINYVLTSSGYRLFVAGPTDNDEDFTSLCNILAVGLRNYGEVAECFYWGDNVWGLSGGSLKSGYMVFSSLGSKIYHRFRRELSLLRWNLIDSAVRGD